MVAELLILLVTAALVVDHLSTRALDAIVVIGRGVVLAAGVIVMLELLHVHHGGLICQVELLLLSCRGLLVHGELGVVDGDHGCRAAIRCHVAARLLEKLLMHELGLR